MVSRRDGALGGSGGRENFRIALASDEILRRRTLLARPAGPRAYFAVFSDHRANVDPVSPSDWTLLCLSKVLTGIRDEREVRSCGLSFFDAGRNSRGSLDRVRNSTRDIRLRLLAGLLHLRTARFIASWSPTGRHPHHLQIYLNAEIMNVNILSYN